MGIVNIKEVEKATGNCLEPGEAQQVQYYIDYVSALVEDYTGTSFTLQEDAVLRRQSDAHGMIELSEVPIEEVSSVAYSTRAVPVAGTGEVLGWCFDGISTISGLKPCLAVDVTLTYGYSTAPIPVKGYVIEAVKYITANPQGLASFRVGDVTQTYVGAGGESTFTSLSNDALQPYIREESSMRLGAYHVPGSPLPTP